MKARYYQGISDGYIIDEYTDLLKSIIYRTSYKVFDWSDDGHYIPLLLDDNYRTKKSKKELKLILILAGYELIK